jgi:hypothetical protein
MKTKGKVKMSMAGADVLLKVCDAPKAQVRQIAGPGLSLRDIADPTRRGLRHP